MQHQARRCDQGHLEHWQGPLAQQCHQRDPQRQGGREVLAQAVVADGRQRASVHHIGGELRRQRALKRVAAQAIPEHLEQDALIHGGGQAVQPPPLQNPAHQGEHPGGQPYPLLGAEWFVHG